jgi:magnesium-transporting ATPase (P-type)
MIYVLMGAWYMKKIPVNTAQLLWINLIMDIFGALALSRECYEEK